MPDHPRHWLTYSSFRHLAARILGRHFSPGSALLLNRVHDLIEPSGNYFRGDRPDERGRTIGEHERFWNLKVQRDSPFASRAAGIDGAGVSGANNAQKGVKVCQKGTAFARHR